MHDAVGMTLCQGAHDSPHETGDLSSKHKVNKRLAEQWNRQPRLVLRLQPYRLFGVVLPANSVQEFPSRAQLHDDIHV